VFDIQNIVTINCKNSTRTVCKDVSFAYRLDVSVGGIARSLLNVPARPEAARGSSLDTLVYVLSVPNIEKFDCFAVLEHENDAIISPYSK